MLVIPLCFLSGLSPFIRGFKASLVADPFYVRLKFCYCKTVEYNDKFGTNFDKKMLPICNTASGKCKHSENVSSDVSTRKMFRLNVGDIIIFLS